MITKSRNTRYGGNVEILKLETQDIALCIFTRYDEK